MSTKVKVCGFFVVNIKVENREKSLFLISGETELEDEFDSCTDTLWIDMPMLSRIFHVIKQVENCTSEKCETVETWVKSLTGG